VPAWQCGLRLYLERGTSSALWMASLHDTTRPSFGPRGFDSLAVADVAYNVAKSGVKVLAEALAHELRGSEHAERVKAHLFVPGFVNTNLAVNYFKDVKGDAFDPEKDVPWSEEKPAKGGWMPLETIDYLFDAVAAGKFYVICPDNDVTTDMDAKRIAWAAGDMISRDVPLSRWDPRFKEEFAEYMSSGTPSDGV